MDGRIEKLYAIACPNPSLPLDESRTMHSLLAASLAMFLPLALTFALNAQAVTLSEVVSVGYGTQSRRDVAGAVATATRFA